VQPGVGTHRRAGEDYSYYRSALLKNSKGFYVDTDTPSVPDTARVARRICNFRRFARTVRTDA
jgi:hypothetical protein